MPKSSSRALGPSALRKYGGMSSIGPTVPFPLTLFLVLCNSEMVSFAQLWSSSDGA